MLDIFEGSYAKKVGILSRDNNVSLLTFFLSQKVPIDQYLSTNLQY